MEEELQLDDIVVMTSYYTSESVTFAKNTKCKVVYGDYNDESWTKLMRLHDKTTLYVPNDKFEKK